MAVKPQDRKLDTELRTLEKKAGSVRVPGADAPFYNSAGDLCADAHDESRALEYYGRAVDAYLNAERWEAAAAMCRKILRTTPGAVRARCTLSWLAIGKGFETDAETEINEYAAAAYQAGREMLAAHQIRRMGELVASPALRISLGEQLLSLGADRAADALFGAAFKERNFGKRPAANVNWSLVREAALLAPNQIDSDQPLTFRRRRAD
jgi:hypothetical protein